MSRSRFNFNASEPDREPDEPEWQSDPDDAPSWHPEHAGEPEPEFNSGEGPAYLAAAAVVVVSFGMALLTVGIHGGRGAWTRPVLASGLTLFLVGLALLALAAWLAGGLDPGSGRGRRRG